ncbi:transferase [Armillaria mellea]|nr:transferase [Armillaria mellea]
MEPIAIAMITDFFHPNVGGVENHVYMLSANLLSVDTSHSPCHVGIRWLLLSLKVYYLPSMPIASSGTLPDFFTFCPTSGRSSFETTSTSSMRVPVYPLSAMKESCIPIYLPPERRENTVPRGELFDKSGRVWDNVYVIPNALVPEHFQPRTPRSSYTVTIVVLSQLAYCKDIDLLIVTATRICAAFPSVRLVVGGDGPKLMTSSKCAKNMTLKTVSSSWVRPNDVRSVLMRGAIFLNTSLTGSFGIAILEAACTGLGVPEILPEDKISFAEPEEDDVFRVISEAIEIASEEKHDPVRAYERIETFYDWAQVAERTEVVYDTVVKSRQMGLWERMKRTMGLGPFAGSIYLIILVVDCLFFMCLEWWFPRDDMDFVVRHWDHVRFAQCANQDPQTATAWSQDSSV